MRKICHKKKGFCHVHDVLPTLVESSARGNSSTGHSARLKVPLLVFGWTIVSESCAMLCACLAGNNKVTRDNDCLLQFLLCICSLGCKLALLFSFKLSQFHSHQQQGQREQAPIPSPTPFSQLLRKERKMQDVRMTRIPSWNGQGEMLTLIQILGKEMHQHRTARLQQTRLNEVSLVSLHRLCNGRSSGMGATPSSAISFCDAE